MLFHVTGGLLCKQVADEEHGPVERERGVAAAVVAGRLCLSHLEGR